MKNIYWHKKNFWYFIIQQYGFIIYTTRRLKRCEGIITRRAHKAISWALMNFNESVVIHSLSYYPYAWAQGVNPSP